MKEIVEQALRKAALRAYVSHRLKDNVFGMSVAAAVRVSRGVAIEPDVVLMDEPAPRWT